ncbi:MAG: type II toxin-antitoxin system CcdA family antitoxin [Pseudorhodoplanes sp.]
MSIANQGDSHKKRPVSVTIRADLLDEAKALDLNASAAAERGIEAAVKAARETRWLEANRKAIEAHNARVYDRGTLLTPSWVEG